MPRHAPQQHKHARAVEMQSMGSHCAFLALLQADDGCTAGKALQRLTALKRMTSASLAMCANVLTATAFVLFSTPLYT